MTIQNLLSNLLSWINTYVLPLLVALAVVFFFIGIIGYIRSGGANEKNAAMKMIGSGILGLVVMLGLWGIISIVTNTFQLGNQSALPIPTVGIH